VNLRDADVVVVDAGVAGMNAAILLVADVAQGVH
jgi:succinate dehydrogenase/fumarate reductase flavoprotein subunit